MTECCCYDFGLDDDENRLYHDKMQRARKAHTCCECRRTIKPGETYQRAEGLDGNGHWFRFATCLGCTRLRDDLRCGRGWFFETLDQAVQDCFGFSLLDEPEEIDDDGE